MTEDSTDLTIRLARKGDVFAILHIISEDESGLHPDRPDGDLSVYERAFDEISADSHNELFVGERDEVVIGSFQLTYIPYLFDRARERALLEAMFVAKAARGQGVGGALVRFALERARKRGYAMVQLDSNKQRVDAHRFYEAAGFQCTHAGFKAIF